MRRKRIANLRDRRSECGASQCADGRKSAGRPNQSRLRYVLVTSAEATRRAVARPKQKTSGCHRECHRVLARRSTGMRDDAICNAANRGGPVKPWAGRDTLTARGVRGMIIGDAWWAGQLNVFAAGTSRGR